MDKPKEHRFERLTDMLTLEPEEASRMLPDLLMWIGLAKEAQAAGADVISFIWVDDGKPGEFSHIDLTNPDTGESVRIDACELRG